MKTTNSIRNSNQPQRVVSANNVFAMLFFICVFTFNFQSVNAQDVISGKKHIDLGIDYFSSGNGHGAFYAPSIAFNKNYNALVLAPMIYKQTQQLSGLKLSYVRNLTGSIQEDYDMELKNDSVVALDSITMLQVKQYESTHKDHFQINFYSYIQYNSPLPLSPSYLLNEQSNSLNDGVNWSQVRMSTGEIGSGIQFQFNLNNHFSFKVYSGLSMYRHLTYGQTLDNGRTSISLNLGSTLLMSFDGFNSKSKHK